MPELPEVEVTRRSLVERLRGARILAVRTGKPLRWSLGCEPTDLVGRVVRDVQRRGKYLWLPLDDVPAQAPGGLLMHLGMSGSLSLGAAAGPLGPWEHFALDTDRGSLILTDPRRFGAVVWGDAPAPAPADAHSPQPLPETGRAGRLLSGLGIEPFAAGFGGAWLREHLRQRRVAIKPALLTGDVVVGVGNIYASEALFLAGIDPRTESRHVGPLRCERLADAIRHVLGRAVALGGTTLRDFRDAHGAGGAFQHEAQVYGRGGETCHRCGRRVRRIVQGQRSTYFCAGCQAR